MSILALLTAWTAPDPLGAQQPSDSTSEFRPRVVGRVVDSETLRPVEQALLTLVPSNRRTLSDSTGYFLLIDIVPGEYQLQIQHVGFETRTVTIDVEPLRTTSVEVGLSSDPIELEEINVQVDYRPMYLESRGFYDRMATGRGHYFDPAWVERWSSGIIRASRLVGITRYYTQSFDCPPETFIDGFRDRSGRLAEMSAWEIGAIEIYPHSGMTPPNTPPSAHCGAIVVWTRRWGETQRYFDRTVDLCVPEFGDGTITVEGQIRDEHTEILLPGARVQAMIRESPSEPLKTENQITDHEGRFRFCDLPAAATITLLPNVLGEDGTGLVLEPEDRRLLVQDLEIEVSGPGRVVGRILDRETGRPVSTAMVSISGLGAPAETDGQGYFLFEGVVPGEQILEVSHLAYETLEDTIAVVADRTVDVRAELSADPFELEPIVVTTVRNRRLETRGFYDRKIWGERIGNGVFFEQKQIDERRPIYISHLVRDLPGIRLDCSTRGCRIGSIRGGGCPEMAVWLDGVQVIRPGEAAGAPVTIDELVRPVEVAAVEVYPGASSLPAEYSGPTGMCGAVVIWTK